MYLFVCVLDDPTRLREILGAWQKAGVPGITVLESTGVRRIGEHLAASEESLFMGFSRLLRPGLHSHNTLFSVVQDMETVRKAMAATEAVIGDLSQPHTGIAFALPLEAAWGVCKDAGPAQQSSTHDR